MDKIDKARDATQMGVTDVVGIDSYFNATVLAAMPLGSLELYFSITGDTIQHIPPQWGIPAAKKLPSTIFRVM